MNETQCANLIESVQWTDPGNLISLAILAFINVLVIVGNCLVIAAVFCSHKLRSVTNFFIVSLAVADLLVGLAVLPFSATWEVFKVWIFGDLWCRVWLAVDVWMCTASILNLCAISLDRYVAVTRPVTYPSIMSTKRAKSLIAGLWVLSFVICFPPLVEWGDDEQTLEYTNVNYTTTTTSSTPAIPDGDDSGFNYTQIISTTTATQAVPIAAVIRSKNPPCPWTCELTNDAGYVVYSAFGSFYIPMFVMLFFYWRIYRAAVRTTRAINQGFRTTKGTKKGFSDFEETPVLLRIHRGKPTGNHQDSQKSSNGTKRSASSFTRRSDRRRSKQHEPVKISVSYPSSEQLPSPTASMTSTHLMNLSRDNLFRENSCRQPGSSGDAQGGPGARKKMKKSNIKMQVKKFRSETKAAKTLGIIVGGFIFCWLPFFTVYLIRAFCENCIERLLFSILFWLGYCNSALNPLIYALFSNDFRIAFKQIIFCTKQTDKSIRVLIESTAANIPFFRAAKFPPNISPPSSTYQQSQQRSSNEFPQQLHHESTTSGSSVIR